jgi:hypothetical protein
MSTFVLTIMKHKNGLVGRQGDFEVILSQGEEQT